MRMTKMIQMRSSFLVAIWILIFWAGSLAAEMVGLQMVPTLTNVHVQSGAAFENTTGLYTYNYIFANPATNTGKIWTIDIDISDQDGFQTLSSQGLTIPFGIDALTFDEVLAIGPHPVLMVPIGMRVPLGWDGGIGRNGFADFTSGDPLTIGSDDIVPGETQGGFEIISPGLPTIREIKLEADWVLLVPTEDDITPELEKRAREVEREITFRTFTLGPSDAFPGSLAHWEQVRDDLNKAITLGWIPDTAFANELVAKLRWTPMSRQLI